MGLLRAEPSSPSLLQPSMLGPLQEVFAVDDKGDGESKSGLCSKSSESQATILKALQESTRAVTNVVISAALHLTSIAAGSRKKSINSSPPLRSHEEPLQKIFAMVKGDEEESYSKNSEYQATINKIINLFLSEALERVSLPSKLVGPVIVADLGSSSGPNTIISADLILRKLRFRVSEGAEFQVYFNDLPSNDFNDLFRLLCDNGTSAQNFFVADVPGTFFGRLFPRSSAHVFYSSFCLHWLSKIPDAVLDERSPAYNRGKTWITHERSAVAEAYRQQASKDLKNFLAARAAELIPGGLLFFSMVGRSTSDPTEHTNDLMGNFLLDLDKIWNDLIAEGLLNAQQLDTFNIPVYELGIEDLRAALASCVSLFHVLTAKLDRLDVNGIDIYKTSDATVLSRKTMGMVKALVNNLLEAAYRQGSFGIHLVPVREAHRAEDTQ